MDGKPGRALRAGVMVCFRDEDTNDLLWQARLGVLPPIGSTCITIANEVETEYKVEDIRFEFLHKNTSDPTGYIEGVAQYDDFTPSMLTHTGPVVIVSEV